MNGGMKAWWKWALAAALAALPWMGGWTHPFLYDDVGMIAENAFLEDPGNWVLAATGRTLGDPEVVNGRRPAVLASYFLDRALHGLEPWGWRASSLLLHMGCVALGAWLAKRLGANGFVVAAFGWLFALHPALVEAVHAPGFRADVLCLFWALGAMHGFLWAGGGSKAGLWLGLGCGALALLSKETALALPLALGAAMALNPDKFGATRGRRATIWVASAALAGAFFAAWAALPAELQALGGSWNGESLRYPQAAYSAPYLWVRSWRWLAWPRPLNVVPGFEAVESAASARFAIGLLGVGLGAWGAWKMRRAEPAGALGLAWAGAFFLPASNLLPLLHPVAERYLYPMAPGFALLLAAGLGRLPRRWGRIALAVLAATYAGLVAERIGEWRSAEVLWETAMERNPKSAVAATWLGLLREEAGDAEGARAYYAEAMRLNPWEAPAWINAGALAGKGEDFAESERMLRRATEIRPGSAAAWQNLAACLERQGRTGEAAEALERAGRQAGKDQGRPKP